VNQKPVLAIVGNCQARPLAQTLSKLVDGGVEISTVAIVHLMKDAEASVHAEALARADWILAQSVADGYPCRFVQTSALRECHGARVLEWPNLFFGGYNPELQYLRGPDRRPLPGPLGDYHNATFLEAWRRGLDVAGALRLNSDDAYNAALYEGSAERALQELARREQATDVSVANWIRERVWKQRLFFTFNHPAQALIRETALQLARRASLPVRDPIPPTPDLAEPLGQYRLPMNPWVWRKHGSTLEERVDAAGVELLEVTPGRVLTGSRRSWTLDELVAAYFRVYDACQDDLRVTSSSARSVRRS